MTTKHLPADVLASPAWEELEAAVVEYIYAIVRGLAKESTHGGA